MDNNHNHNHNHNHTSPSSSSSPAENSSSHVVACWVPLRIRKNAINEWKVHRGPKPFIELWQEQKGGEEEPHNITTTKPLSSSSSWNDPSTFSESSPPLIVGRREFLETMKAACGCHNSTYTTDVSSSIGKTSSLPSPSSSLPSSSSCWSVKNHCPECEAIQSWAVTRLSRQLIRIHKKHLQIRGVNAKYVVRLNQQFVVGGTSSAQQHPSPLKDTKEWTVNVPLQEGSILTLGSDQQEPTSLLEFQLVYIDFSTNTSSSSTSCSRVEESTPRNSKNVHPLSSSSSSSSSSSLFRPASMTPQPNKTTLKSKNNNDHHASSFGTFGIDWSNPPCDLKVHPPRETIPWIPPTILQRRNRTHEDPSTQQGTTTGAVTHPSSSNVQEEHHHAKSHVSRRSSSYRLFFLPLGQSMPPRRVETLKCTARDKGAMVVDTWETKTKKTNGDSGSSVRLPPPTHLVLDGTLNAETVATHLKFSTVLEFTQCLTTFSIETVTPDWVAFSGGNHQTLEEPTLNQLWAGRPRVAGSSSSWWSPSKRKRTHERVSSSSPSSPLSSLSTQWRDKDTRRQRRNSRNPPIVNEGLSKMFAKLAKLHQDCPLRDDDLWKGYMNTLISGRLRHLPFEVMDDDNVLQQVHAIKGFGESTIHKIRDYFRTGTCSKIIEFEQDPERVAMNTMMHIWGVGKAMARKLVLDMKLTSLDQVRAAISSGQVEFSPNQLIGLDCWEDFREKMKRSEVEQIGKIVEKAVMERIPSAQVTIMGSYRRGKPTSGDIDILILVPEFVKTTPKSAIDELVERLRRQGHISHHLSKVRRTNEKSYHDHQVLPIVDPTHIATYPTSQSYMGVFLSPVFPGKRRRIDIKMYPYRERVFASMYFTGNGWFNRSIRLYASRLKGLSLNDHGIFAANSASHIPRPEEDLLLEAQTDKDVFDFLGLVYKAPDERDCFDAVLPKEEDLSKSLATLEYSRGEIRNENHPWIE